MPTPSATLRASLEKHNDTFESLLKLIPAQYYIVNDETEEQVSYLSWNSQSQALSSSLSQKGSLEVSEAQQETKGSKTGYQRGYEKSKAWKGFLRSHFFISKFLTHFFVNQLDPANYKSIVDIQNENYLKQRENSKGKRRASSSDSDEDEDISMNVDVDMKDLDESDEEQSIDEDTELQSMPAPVGIEALREKLHNKMASLRRGGRHAAGEPSDKDTLLDERRMQRAAMRERRRKETKEKIRREEEMKMKGRKKDKDKTDTRDKGNTTKVF